MGNDVHNQEGIVCEEVLNLMYSFIQLFIHTT